MPETPSTIRCPSSPPIDSPFHQPVTKPARLLATSKPQTPFPSSFISPPSFPPTVVPPCRPKPSTRVLHRRHLHPPLLLTLRPTPSITSTPTNALVGAPRSLRLSPAFASPVASRLRRDLVCEDHLHRLFPRSATRSPSILFPRPCHHLHPSTASHHQILPTSLSLRLLYFFHLRLPSTISQTPLTLPPSGTSSATCSLPELHHQLTTTSHRRSISSCISHRLASSDAYVLQSPASAIACTMMGASIDRRHFFLHAATMPTSVPSFRIHAKQTAL